MMMMLLLVIVGDIFRFLVRKKQIRPSVGVIAKLMVCPRGDSRTPPRGGGMRGSAAAAVAAAAAIQTKIQSDVGGGDHKADEKEEEVDPLGAADRPHFSVNGGLFVLGVWVVYLNCSASCISTNDFFLSFFHLFFSPFP